MYEFKDLRIFRLVIVEMDPDRYWMYERTKNGIVLPSFEKGLDSFIAFALAHPDCLKVGDMKCSCSASKCRNMQWLSPKMVKQHVRTRGFVPKYEVWNHHGETAPLLHDYGSARKIRRTKDLWSVSAGPSSVHDDMDAMLDNESNLEYSPVH